MKIILLLMSSLFMLSIKEKNFDNFYEEINDGYSEYIKNVFDNEGEEFSMDRNVYERLKQKEQTMLDAIDNHELEPVYTPEEDLKIIFGNLL